MEREGPPLELLTRRLAETPEDFLAAPRIGATGSVEVAAVVGDLAALLGSEPPAAEQLAAFESDNAQRDRNRLCLVLVLCWLLADEWFRSERPNIADVWQLLGLAASELAIGNADRVMQAARVAEERARAVREALVRKAAQEAADKYTRE